MPPETDPPDRAAAFEAERGRLTGLAYRMLGSMTDAEDVVQDAWLRWDGATRQDISKPGAYLSRIVTRLCLDRLKQARHRREVYVGPWLPEPVLSDPAAAGEPDLMVEKDISYALMLALERLSPLERAAFILYDIFDMPFGEIATVLGRGEQACRQLASRARAHIRKSRPRFKVPPDEADSVAAAFFAASKSGDLNALGRLLAENAELHSDGGGRKLAALNVIYGARKVARFYAGLARKPAYRPPLWSRRMRINGLPANLTIEADGSRQVTLVELDGSTVVSVYLVCNPDKIEPLWRQLGEPGAG
ncbi:sigma-70 family RNA polymerase sigma factor [Nitratireductor sp. XY-223]|uniref:sigma-70 family RNA polymerase sigma factor n=1 Tax=Nitratireductor sp. XY-223 TaxID=2561926 RepID=UPI0010AAD870|nr:sigma-70 family RNA polymerase sigma factor [Nitratireductor sp. XY-223]